MKHCIKNLTYPQWYSSHDLKLSYLRMYKSGSSTIVDLLGDYKQDYNPIYPKFTIIRDPYTRAKSIWREICSLQQKNLSFKEYTNLVDDIGFWDKHQLSQAFWLKDSKDIYIFKLEEPKKWIEFMGVDPDTIINHNVKRKTKDTFESWEKDWVRKVYNDDIFLYKIITLQK